MSYIKNDMVIEHLSEIGYCKNKISYDEVLSYLKDKHQIEVYTTKDKMPEFDWNYGPVRNPIWNVYVNELYLPKERRIGLVWESFYHEHEALDAGIYKACSIILNKKNLN